MRNGDGGGDGDGDGDGGGGGGGDGGDVLTSLWLMDVLPAAVEPHQRYNVCPELVLCSQGMLYLNAL